MKFDAKKAFVAVAVLVAMFFAFKFVSKRKEGFAPTKKATLPVMATAKAALPAMVAAKTVAPVKTAAPQAAKVTKGLPKPMWGWNPKADPAYASKQVADCRASGGFVTNVNNNPNFQICQGAKW